VITVEDRSGAPWSVLEELAWTFDDGLLELAAGGRCGAPYRVVYTAGYTELPKPLRAAVLMMLADMYENRAGDELMSPAVKAMTRPFVVYY
jgi:hypothetical protein